MSVVARAREPPPECSWARARRVTALLPVSSAAGRDDSSSYTAAATRVTQHRVS